MGGICDEYSAKNQRAENTMNQLINPQSSHKNDKNESWLILLCGSNPMIGAVHIEVFGQSDIKCNDKQSQSVTNWFSATAKSLFHRKSHQNDSKIKRSQSTLSNMAISPSKCVKNVQSNL